ncbi:hypothetical protein A2628_05110 [Candidatus Woesebacteria bacterium RIFCSPHIGHO2_01_FULL_40_22]|uniref:Cell envelope-related transcriptional attenuator n=2 Tax=Microgenomates group TaxID=1794810 RepID=A0A0H4T3N6_9BACT|nr:cell envelope-related transcriptional attenuator [uncultured Microgenomates bacterium Rifle_16ft_4_minimus_37633]OGM27769.1 MAG: hypothetical protein A2628_05110 [Candidatus Woesebacteria bacterium RIFCSPHIGHO2_01_FULL_40_22]
MQQKKIIPKSKIKLAKWRIFFSRIKRRVLSHVWPVRISLILIGLVCIVVPVIFIRSLVISTNLNSYLNYVTDFIFPSIAKVKAIDDRVNILFLGKGGGDHEAPDLTDTMILISVNLRNNTVTLISLSRDIWIPELRTKLNNIYYWGNQKKPPVLRTSGPEEPGGGLALSKSVVEQVIGEDIQYGVVMDFEGFVKAIDAIGGIYVGVENSFKDEKYPIPGREDDVCGGDPLLMCRYETIVFEKGGQFMDGSTALKFARSRNAEESEGTDFARAGRQQKVISAVKNKLLDESVLFSPKKILAVKNILNEHMESDLNSREISVLARYFWRSRNATAGYVIPENLLEVAPKSTKYDNLYVLIPKSGNWDEVHTWIRGVLK